MTIPIRPDTVTRVVDHIEGDIAVIVTDAGERRDVPLSQLPPGVREGDVIRGGAIDRAEGERRRMEGTDRLDRMRARGGRGLGAMIAPAVDQLPARPSGLTPPGPPPSWLGPAPPQQGGRSFMDEWGGVVARRQASADPYAEEVAAQAEYDEPMMPMMRKAMKAPMPGIGRMVNERRKDR